MTTTAVSLDLLRDIIAEALRPGHFYVPSGTVIQVKHLASEEMSWEIFKGRLLDPSQTRLRQTFESWNVYRDGEQEPVLAIKLDADAGQVHVVRAIYSYAWEGYHAGDNVYSSREVCKWIRELVGTIAIAQAGSEDLREEITTLIFQAVVGSSRLPILSTESPLPAFSLGQLAYFHGVGVSAAAPPVASYGELITQALVEESSESERSRLVETVLRTISVAETGTAAALLHKRFAALGWHGRDLTGLVRKLFNEVALSPYTSFVDNLVLFLGALTDDGLLTVEQHVDLLSYFLRQTARHLTAYDIVTFHHRGANYPDALLLDTVLRAYQKRIEQAPHLFRDQSGADNASKRGRMRRRALRQGWLMWHLLQGLPVPDAPTSPGENARILPPPHVRVPEEQILQPSKRTKRLYDGQSLAPTTGQVAEVLSQAMEDLREPDELRELGTAIFLARPLAGGKAPGEADRTVLLSYEAFSRSLAKRRLDYLATSLRLIPDSLLRTLEENLPHPGGAAIPRRRSPERPGAVSLQDATKVAEDFVFLRTTGQTAQEFLDPFDLLALAERLDVHYLKSREPILIMPGSPDVTDGGELLTIYDFGFQRRLELRVDYSLGYQLRKGKEYPRAGLEVLRAWQSLREGGPLEEKRFAGVTVQPRC